LTSKRQRLYDEIERMRTVYRQFPSDRLRQIIRTGTIKEYVTAAKEILKERGELEPDSK